MEIVLAIIGSFLAICLGINGYFLRGIFQDLNDVKINIAVMISQSNEKEKIINELKENEKEIFKRLTKLEVEVLK